MVNLFLRSVLVLALLFGLLFAVGMGVLAYFDMPLWISVVFALAVLLLQYLLGPWILELIYKIEWQIRGRWIRRWPSSSPAPVPPQRSPSPVLASSAMATPLPLPLATTPAMPVWPSPPACWTCSTAKNVRRWWPTNWVTSPTGTLW